MNIASFLATLTDVDNVDNINQNKPNTPNNSINLNKQYNLKPRIYETNKTNETNQRKNKFTLRNNLSRQTKKKILSYQEPHIIKLINLILEHSIAIDMSDTGIGKTYVACAICLELGIKPIVICPKTLIFNWITVLDLFGVDYYDVVNYETIKNGKTYNDRYFKSRVKSSYLGQIYEDYADPTAFSYYWDVPIDSIIIFDEVHRCKEPNTDNGKLLMSSKSLIRQNIPLLLLSATICEKPIDMKIPFYLLDLINSTKDFNKYMQSLKSKYPKYKFLKSDYPDPCMLKTATEKAKTMIIYEQTKIYSSRIRIKDIGDKFQNNQICCQHFFAPEFIYINEAYNKIGKLMVELGNNTGKHHLARIQKLKQEIELRKVPIFIEQSNLYLEAGKSVVIFVNYLDTLNVLAESLNICCRLHGKQTMQDRLDSIELFQSNREKIIICQIRAGGVGIGLHDVHGDHPRVSLINFPDSATDLIQALGRIYRSGTKTPALQRIIFVANVDYEKKIMENINNKLANLFAANDGCIDDLQYNIK